MVRKRKAGPRKATVPLSQIAAQMQEESAAGASGSGAAAPTSAASSASASSVPASDASGASTSTSTSTPSSSAPAAEGSPSASSDAATKEDGADDAAADPEGSAFLDAMAEASEMLQKELGFDDASDPDEEAFAAAAEGEASEAASEQGDAPADPGQAAVPDASSATAERSSGKRSAAKRSASGPSLKKPKHLGLWIAAAVAALVVIAVAAFSWDRWLRYDDAVDLQGQWRIADTTGLVTIDEGSIHLTEKEAYTYTMDAGAKTLTFTFGDLSGQARYRFSADRTQVAIQDGEFDAMGTLMSDIAWSWSCLIGTITGQPQTGPDLGEGSLVLERVTGDAAAPSADAAAGSEESGASSSDGQAAQDAAAGEGTDGAAVEGSDSATGEGSEGSADAADDQAAQDQAAQDEAAAEEERQNELRIQEALKASGSNGSVGSNAITPEDLM